MTNFLIGAIVGFMICVWALDVSPRTAFSALWARLEHVQQVNAAPDGPPAGYKTHSGIAQEPAGFR
jgi:hypothetical protein